VRANVAVLQRDMVGSAWFLPIAAAAWIEAVPLHQEFRQPRDGVRDPARFIFGEMLARERPLSQAVPIMHHGASTFLIVELGAHPVKSVYHKRGSDLIPL
jgi:hypothetical protein